MLMGVTDEPTDKPTGDDPPSSTPPSGSLHTDLNAAAKATSNVVDLFDAPADTTELSVRHDEPHAADHPSSGPPADYIEPWARQEWESDLMWDRFRWYRDLGPTRTRRQLAEHYGLSRPAVDNMMLKGNWVDRLLAFDRHEDWVYRTQREIELREMAARHGGQIVEALEALHIPFAAISARLAEDPETVNDLSKRDFQTLLKMAAQSSRVIPSLMQAERLARGLPTEIVEETVEVTVRQELSRDTVADIIETLASVGAFDAGATAGADSEIVDAEFVEVHTGEDETGIAAETDRLPGAD